MKIAGLIPAFNASKTITRVIERIPAGELDWLVVVNDGSSDRTAEVLAGITSPVPLLLLEHPENRGYGAAQKSLYEKALSLPGCDAVVIFHADGGHFPEEIPKVLEPIRAGTADLVVGSRVLGILKESRPLLGSRFLGAVFNGPMPGYKFVCNNLLTMLQNSCYGTRFHSFHCGFRAMSFSCLRQLPFRELANWYIYDTELLLAAHRQRLRISEVPVSAFYDPDAGSGVPGIRYGLRILQHCAAVLQERLCSRAASSKFKAGACEDPACHKGTESFPETSDHTPPSIPPG